MRNNIEPKLLERDINWVEIGLEPEPWDKTIQNIFKKHHLSSDTQHVYTLRGSHNQLNLKIERYIFNG